MTGLEGRLPEPGKKVKILAANIDNMENRSRWDNTDVPNLEEGTGGNTLSTFSKPGCPLCYHTTTEWVAFSFIMLSACLPCFLNMKKVLVVFPSVENGNVHTSTLHLVHGPNDTVLHSIRKVGHLSLYPDHSLLVI